MKTAQVPTRELVDDALDWAVIESAQNLVNQKAINYQNIYKALEEIAKNAVCSPSSDWAQGGLLIESCFINIEHSVSGWGSLFFIAWPSFEPKPVKKQGDKPLVAAMRALVQLVYGDTAEIPEELVK